MNGHAKEIYEGVPGRWLNPPDQNYSAKRDKMEKFIEAHQLVEVGFIGGVRQVRALPQKEVR
jgi:hypothetical protein